MEPEYTLVKTADLWEEKGLQTERGTLVLSTKSILSPTLTVELETKWYSLFLVSLVPGISLGTVTIHAIGYGHLESVRPDGMSAYVDHVPNPLCVQLFARRNGYEIDELAGDLIKGRWQNEVVEWRVMECERCDGKGVIEMTVASQVLGGPTCRACRGLGILKPAE